MKKEKIIRVIITADVAEKLQQVGNVSAYIRSALIAKMENEKLIKIKIPFDLNSSFIDFKLNFLICPTFIRQSESYRQAGVCASIEVQDRKKY